MLDLGKATNQAAAERVRLCAVDLLLRAPLFGLMLLGHAIRVREDTKIETMMTDGRTIWYAPSWVLRKPRPSIMFDLLHETLHVFGNHPARGRELQRDAWGYAIDVRVAHDGLAICRAQGPWELDSDHIKALPWAEKLSAEQIYEKLLKEPDRIPKNFKPDTKPPEETPEEERAFKQQLVQDLAQGQVAEEQRQSRGKKSIEERYGSSVWERLQELKRCEVPWSTLLQGRLCDSFGHDVASWVPPNRRYLPMIALPSRRATTEELLLLGIDVSGSINDHDTSRFRGCILPAARRAKKIVVVTFDAVVREVYVTTKPETLLRNIHFRTGSHSYTDTRGVFAEVEARRPSAVAILTDGHIRLPDKAYPQTHWVLKPGGAHLPWGKHYQMHYSW